MGKVRRILSVSGGKDSAALAIYMRDRVTDLEYVFCDTEKELPETYDYLAKLELVLGKPITILKNDGRGFDHYLDLYRGYLPSPGMRWCTRHLKLEPFERYVGNDEVESYVGIRADEDREGYISTKPNIKPIFPFKDAGLGYADVVSILNEAGIGLPSYRKWRSRSGCYFCFFQQKIEWVGLLENHPDLYELASKYEKTDEASGRRFTWGSHESLKELALPERVAAIKAEHERRLKHSRQNSSSLLLDILDDPDEPKACAICSL